MILSAKSPVTASSPVTHYRLDEDGNPVPEPDVARWERWRTEENIRVALERIGDCEVSTVFLGADDTGGAGGSPAPKLWETMIFGGCLDEVTVRCSGSRREVEAMHAEVAQRVRGSGL